MVKLSELKKPLETRHFLMLWQLANFSERYMVFKYIFHINFLLYLEEKTDELDRNVFERGEEWPPGIPPALVRQWFQFGI